MNSVTHLTLAKRFCLFGMCLSSVCEGVDFYLFNVK